MIGIFGMLVSVREFLMRLPIVKMLCESREERERTVDLIREQKQQLEEHKRRVQVLEWMTYPHTNHRPGNHHEPH